MSFPPLNKHALAGAGVTGGVCGCCIFSFWQNPWLQHWDIITMVSLCFTAIVAPVEVAFLTTQLDALFFFDRLVDLVFVTVRGQWRKGAVGWRLEA